MDQPDIPQPPLSAQVTRIASDYTVHHSGDWVKDPNTHFEFGGKNYYVEKGKDINDRSNWMNDTMAGHHRSEDQYQQHLAQQKQDTAMAKQVEHNASMLAQAQSRLDLERRRFEADQKRIEQELKRIEAEKKEREKAEADRLARRQKGRKATILTSGQGLGSPAPTNKKALLGA